MSSVRRCSARRKDGQPCRAIPMKGSDPPLCAVHAGKVHGGARRGNVNARKHGFYSRSFTLEEIADLVTLAVDDDLGDELAAARVAVRRVMESLQQELTPEEFARTVNLVFKGTTTVAQLMRAQRSLSGQSADGIAGAIALALDELANEWGVEL